MLKHTEHYLKFPVTMLSLSHLFFCQNRDEKKSLTSFFPHCHSHLLSVLYTLHPICIILSQTRSLEGTHFLAGAFENPVLKSKERLFIKC